MRVFIVGAEGQLGRDCMDVFSGEHEVRGMDFPSMDITSKASIRGALDAFSPDLVVNAAAYTQVDAAEEHRDQAWAINATGPQYLAEYMSERGGQLVHISTDYVFSGKRPVPDAYVETDVTEPCSVYGQSKLAGERAVLRAADRFVVIRTAWLYGANGHNFLRAILRQCLLYPGRPLRVVNDQFGSPTWSWRLALQIAALGAAGGRGLYHASAEGACTWLDLAGVFLREMGIVTPITPCATREYPTPAPRPMNSILENRRLKMANLNVMRDWKDDVIDFVAAHGDSWRTQVV